MYHFVDRITASLSDRRLGISLEGEREREMERESDSEREKEREIETMREG
jgi:hypothetical protein